MTMLAETVDAVIGIDTRRDNHEVEIADTAGRPIAAMRISNDSAGFSRLLAAIATIAPGPRVAVCMEGSRSYGIGLARALAAAGLMVLECEQPSRRQRRGKGKSDPIGAHLAVLAALRPDASRLPVPRADGDREALRILLVARQEITMARTAQTGRLRALLLTGDDTDRQAARKALTQAALTALAERELPVGAPANRPSARPRSAASHKHQPGPGRQRPDHPAPAQPRGRPGTESRHPRHRAGPDARLPAHPGLRRTAHRRRKDATGNPPLPQALHRPRALPAAHPDDESSRSSLTNIEASKEARSPAARAWPATMPHPACHECTHDPGNCPDAGPHLGPRRQPLMEPSP
jgi:transposase